MTLDEMIEALMHYRAEHPDSGSHPVIGTNREETGPLAGPEPYEWVIYVDRKAVSTSSVLLCQE